VADPFAERRAAAAADSVTLAAAGMSSGETEPEEVAAPATTLIGVEEADEVESHPPDSSDVDPTAEPADDSDETGDVSAGEADPEPVDHWSEHGLDDDPADGDDADDPDEDDGEDEDGDLPYDDDDDRELGGEGRAVRAGGIPAQPVNRPLGSAPLLDSQPLPATRPGMLRPRTVDRFSLPAQRPAFDVGPGEPADIA
jgi:arginase